MDVVCRPDIPCFCRPLTTPELLFEHVLLGGVQLVKAFMLSFWLHVQQGHQVATASAPRLRRGMSADKRLRPWDGQPLEPASSVVESVRTAAAAAIAPYPRARFVLPVYSRFLTIEAWQCFIWGVFYLSQSYFDWSRDGRPLVTVLFQLMRYLSSFTMAVSGATAQSSMGLLDESSSSPPPSFPNAHLRSLPASSALVQARGSSSSWRADPQARARSSRVLPPRRPGRACLRARPPYCFSGGPGARRCQQVRAAHPSRTGPGPSS